VIVFAFAGDSTMTRRVPSLIGGIAAPRPPVVRRDVPLRLADRVVVRVVVGFVPFVAFAVVRVVFVVFVVFVVGFFAIVAFCVRATRLAGCCSGISGTKPWMAIRSTYALSAAAFFFVSSGIAPLLSVRS
jgi:hypothetical protein